ncbi:MAG: heavy-metal-associated domain-containing protein [Flavobacteriales bacterium]
MQEQEDRTYVKIVVGGLACPFCAYGLEKKLKKVEGQKDLYIDVQGGYARFSVPKGKKPSKEALKKRVKKAGFEAKKVRFSEDPFEDAAKKKE